MVRESLDIPHSMRRVYRRLERWRLRHRDAPRSPIPEGLWGAAVELAQKYGVFHTAKALHLEYGKLKRLAESASPSPKRSAKHRWVAKAPAAGTRRARSTAPPAFVELMTSPAVGLAEWLIELEGPRGKMRIQWKGTTAPDLSGLSRAFWESR